MAVRTKLLAFGDHNLATGVIAYTVPTDCTVIVKEIIVVLYSTVVTEVQVFARDPAGHQVTLLYTPLDPYVPQYVPRWTVLQEGQELVVGLNQNESTRFWISGTVLEGEAGSPVLPTQLPARLTPIEPAGWP